ncbi:MAG: adenylate/guanylate cyclase domain-containing protein, partial [Terriglobales bacterium]
VLVGLVDNAAENRAPFSDATIEERQPNQSWVTPVSRSGAPMSSIEVQANVISNLLHDRYLNEPPLWKLLVIIGLLSVTLGKLLGKLHNRPWVSLAALVCFALLWMAGSFIAFSSFHSLIPVVVPVVAVMLPAWALVVADAEAYEKRERRRRTRVFRSLAAKPLAQEIERKLLAELGLEGKRMTVTVVACQLRNLVGDDEDESAEAVMERLNSCLSIMMACVGDSHGLVERIWNSGVIGIWGAPIAMPEEKQAKLAAECALSMRKRLFEFRDNRGDISTGLNFNFTCGINTGDSVCGTISAASRDTSLTHYGALGPAVDHCVELEALNPSYGTSFMIGSSTAALLAETFEVREIDRRKLERRDTIQSIYELLPWEGSLPGALEEAMALFKQGRAALEEGRIQEAEQLFSTSLRMVPHDKPTMIMLDRCREMIGKTPGSQEFVQKMTLKERLSEGRD